MAALVLAGLVAAGVVAPAQAAPAVGTVSFSGDPGDYITQGAGYSYTSPGDRISLSGDAAHVGIVIQSLEGDFWSIDAAAPPGEVLTSGTTYDATRYPFNEGAGFDLGGNGRGCNTSTSTFTVQAITTDEAGAVTRFAATFEQHCDGQEPAARGQVDVGLETPGAPLQLSVANTGARLDQSGGIVITGTLTCTSDAMTYVNAIVAQTVRKVTIQASGGTYVDCWPDRNFTWDLFVYSSSPSFQPGAITVTTSATADDPFTGQQVRSEDADGFRLKRPRSS